MPASTILVLESTDDRRCLTRPDPDQRRLHRHPYHRRRRSLRAGRRAPAGRHRPRERRRQGGKTGVELCREIRATPAMAAVPILCVAATRRRRGAHRLPRGRRRRRHRPAVRRPRGRGAGRGAAAALPALEGPRPGRLSRRAHAGSAPAHRRRVQPQGRRRDDDHGDEHRRRGGPAQGRPGRPGRPRPAVRRRRDAPQPRAQADHRRRRPRRGRAARAGAAADVRDAPRQRPARPGGAGITRRRRS